MPFCSMELCQTKLNGINFMVKSHATLAATALWVKMQMLYSNAWLPLNLVIFHSTAMYRSYYITPT